VVQQTIDRIIFLRIAEDRNIEPYGALKDAVKQGEFYQNVFRQFEQADEKYNSGLFDFKKDKISRNIKVDNKVIKTIINELYFPDSPYEFSVLPVEILGSAYEQFLGKVIRITPAHHAKIEEKPAVRKAGGVYYTPHYVVDYIVQNTVGKLIEGKTPKEVSKIKILDPACGSGSFLIGAYQYLVDWHTNYYNNIRKLQSLNSKGKKGDVLRPDGNLATSEKKRILLNNIYGVDIDLNAVEVSKLSLLLKCMEGETEASINHQLRLFNDRVLPTLDDNIKSGNSLVDTDFFTGEFDFDKEKKIKPFNWQRSFPDVFKIEKPSINRTIKYHNKKVLAEAEEQERKAKELIHKLGVRLDEPEMDYGLSGGFDVVIGNPPYLGGREWKEENGNIYGYFINKYQVAEYQFDIYALFWEAGIKLLKPNGKIGYITPNTWLNNQSNKKLRTFILDNLTINKIVDYSRMNVFHQASVLPIVTILSNEKRQHSNTEILEPGNGDYRLINTINQCNWYDGDMNIININLSDNDLTLRKKIEDDTVPLQSLALIKFGIKLYETGKGIPKQKPNFAKDRIYEADQRMDGSYRKYLEGKDIHPYIINYKNRWLKYGKNLAAPRDPGLFEGERILVRRIAGKTLIAAYTDSDFVTSQLLQIVKPSDPAISKFLLGVLNSKLIAYYFRKKYNRQDKTFPEIRIYELASLPIKRSDISNYGIRVKLIKLVDQLIFSCQEREPTRLNSQREQLKSKIEFYEHSINQLVYQLYELTDDEIAAIENSNL
jgi:adenine-specific DNA-methyltransferase